MVANIGFFYHKKAKMDKKSRKTDDFEPFAPP